jgi:hypothetical protein
MRLPVIEPMSAAPAQPSPPIEFGPVPPIAAYSVHFPAQHSQPAFAALPARNQRELSRATLRPGLFGATKTLPCGNAHKYRMSS